MKSKFLLPGLLIGAAALVAVVLLFALDTGTPPAVVTTTEAIEATEAEEEVNYADLSGSVATTSAPAEAPVPVGSSVSAPPGGSANVDWALAANTAGNETAKDQVLEIIENAMVTYSPEGLTVLGPLLKHSDPEIREASIEGIIQLGEKSGVKTLREAARQTKNPVEARRMLQAAEFLELPEYEP